MFRMTIRRERNTGGTPLWYAGLDHFFDLVKVEHSILFEDLVVSMPARTKEHTRQANASISADLEFLCQANVRLHYPASVKVVATGYTNPIAVAMVHGTVIVAERMGNVYCLDVHSKLQVKVATMKKADMEAFVARHKVHVDHQHAKNHSREELKSAINQFLQSNKKSVTSKGTKLDLEPCVKTPVAVTSFAGEILFIADTGTKRLVEVRVEKADFKLECHVQTVVNLKDNVNPTGLCVIEGQQKLLLADSGTFGGLLVINLEDGTTQQLLKNGSTLCSQIHGVSLSGHSVIFTDTKSHTLKRFSLEASVLDGTKVVQKVDTIIGNGTSGTEDGLISVARVSHPTGITTENNNNNNISVICMTIIM